MPFRPGWRLLTSGVLGGILWVGYGLLAGPIVAEPPGIEAAPPPRVIPAWQASTSCASSACHGADVRASTRGCEYTLWASRDRHANAYTVLLEERSQTIERNLRGPKAKPETDALCLRCHTTQAERFDHEARARSQPAVTLLEGVGCDRCHSTRPGARWINQHYAREWPAMTDGQKRAAGFRPLGDLVSQARLCAECHVGTPEADVDHDLIAAGHPPLRFELSAFRATMPPHWDLRKRRERQPDLEARTWAVGRLVAAEFALDLLAARAEKKGGTWPEFAEYSCNACHQPLRAAATKPEGRLPGSLPWGTWFTAGLPDATGAYARKNDGNLLGHLQDLRAAMRKPEPDRSMIAKQAAALAAEMRAHADRLPGAATLTSEQARLRFAAMLARPISDWDDATQRYLALAALYHTLTDMDAENADADIAAALRRLAKQLGFPAERDSPSSFDATAFSRELQKLQRHVERPGLEP